MIEIPIWLFSFGLVSSAIMLGIMIILVLMWITGHFK